MESVPANLDEYANFEPIFNAIIEDIPAPKVNIEGSLQLLVTSLTYDNFLGKYAIGRITRGSVKTNEQVS